jgi:AAA+ superfamily predicted ATPase
MKRNELYNSLMSPYLEQGHNVFIVNGPRINDVFPIEYEEKISIRPCFRAFSDEARDQGFIVIQNSFSSGVVINLNEFMKKDSDSVTHHLNRFNILPSSSRGVNPEEEFVTFSRGILRMIRENATITLSDGRIFRFLFWFDFVEHQVPNSQGGSTMQKVGLELIHELVFSLALRKSGSVVVLNQQCPEGLNHLLKATVPSVEIESSTNHERELMVAKLKVKYDGVSTSMNDQEIVSLSSNMLNRSIEKMFFASHQFNKVLSPYVIAKEKKQDVKRQTEGMLVPVENSTKTNELRGRNIQPVLELTQAIAEDIKSGKRAPQNILLAGAMSTGKTIIAQDLALNTGLPPFLVGTLKSPYVGSSEANADRLLRTIESFGGAITADEITELMGLRRSTENLDSGVSDSLMAKFQTHFSKESNAGKVLWIGTTNRPEIIPKAMFSRWIICPVLSPLKEDMPEILYSICLDMEPSLDLRTDELIEASEKFYNSGASIRDIKNSLTTCRSVLKTDLSLALIDQAASAIIPSTNLLSKIYADLAAIRLCSSMVLLPFWNKELNEPDINYPYPEEWLELMDQPGYFNFGKLDRRLEELRPHANI